ncbi:T4SS efffector SepA family protein [Salipiger sp. PrR003]|uniref:T4SS efffector SepA family protein n=1 Tax=Salipiger sp. PrR003 TaxID=2706776 RepID=UPI0013DAA765|nr:hypothetical protein [Salipiger sp. PrR003]NDV50654.1 hypothetical protein [Salipiger sp. PrR003]
MPDIVLSRSAFERLQSHAQPLIDTPESVILRALDALEQQTGRATPHASVGGSPEREIDTRALPRLTHTKLLDATIDGEPLTKPNWNSLLDEMLRRAMQRVGSFDELQRICPVNMVKGRKEDEGYGHLPEIDVSVQGQDANGACRAVVTAAQALGTSLEIGFMWRHKENAAHPGELGRIRISPRAQSTRK